MRKRNLIFILILAAMLMTPPWNAQEADTPSEDELDLGIYHPPNDAFQDVEAAAARAKKEGKRVMMVVGGNWCDWCSVLDAFILETPAVKEAIKRHFVFQKVFWGPRKKNEEFLSQFPEIKLYPHIFLLDGDGKLLHSQETEPLEMEGMGEKEKEYDEAKFLAFLEKWKPGGKGPKAGTDSKKP